MANYTGLKCPVCSRKFASDDDIVVCPVCGAPHHRGCYSQKGECAFSEEHLSGKEWRPPQDAAPPPESGTQYGPQPGPGGPQHTATRRCTACGASNPQDSLFCQVCGNRMAAGSPGPGAGPQQNNPYGPAGWNGQGFHVHFDPQAFIYGGVDPESEIAGEKVKDVAAYVGKNSAYYLPRFLLFGRGLRLSFNFSALILGLLPSIFLNFMPFNFLYFFHRKMNMVGVILLILSIVGIIPVFLYAREMLPELIQQEPLIQQFVLSLSELNVTVQIGEAVDQSAANFYWQIMQMAYVLNIAVSVIVAMLANRLYFNKVIGSVKKIREGGDASGAMYYQTALSMKGGTSAAVPICASIAAFFLVGVLPMLLWM